VEEARRLALERRPDLRRAKAAEERGEAEVRVAEAEGRADITITAEYALRNERLGNLYGLTAGGQMAALRDRDSLVTGGVSIPLFARRRNEGNLEAAAARAVGARTWRQHLEASIPLEVQAAWERWRAAARSAGILSAEVVGQSERNLAVMRQAYELGQLRLLDLLNEQRRLVETRMAQAEAEGEMRRCWIELERAVGGELK
jgi:cobalt-zinc-cadmium efflux system outer membrane protein